MRDERLLYCSLVPTGGLADYSHEQANALVRRGVDVTLLSSPEFFRRTGCLYRCDDGLQSGSQMGQRTSAIGKLRRGTMLIANVRQFAQRIADGGFKTALMGSYVEYLAPFWAGRLRSLAEQKVVFGSVVHDPVRDFVVGPRWWHRRSIASGYSFLREAFVHEPIELDTVHPVPSLRTTVIPCGPYRFPPPSADRGKLRESLGIPASALVLLAFGHVRDNKNLDLVIQAIANVPAAHLVVAGKANSARQKTIEYYQGLAKEHGLYDRCHWIAKFIPEEEFGDLFSASDIVLLTYSRSFRSASGVLNTAVHYKRQCIASGGQGNLQTVVQKYGLGVWITADDVGAIREALIHWDCRKPVPKWEAYEHENSWERNAEIVWEQMKTSLSRSATLQTPLAAATR